MNHPLPQCIFPTLLALAAALAGLHAAPYTYPGTGSWSPPSSLMGVQHAPNIQAFPMDAVVNEAPPSITLRIYSTPTPGSGYNTNLSGNYDIYRKAPESQTWAKVASSVAVGTAITTWTDSNVVVGQMYEYGASPTGQSVNFKYGFLLAGIKADQTLPKGRVALVVTSDVPDRLPVEYAQFKEDLVRDGWVVNEILTTRGSYTGNGTGANDAQGVPTAPFPSEHINIRNQLIALYQDAGHQYPGLPLRNVILLGRAPVARSGLSNIAPDGHDNAAALGADAYYADMDGVWPDRWSNEPFITAGTLIPGFVNNADNTVTLPTSMVTMNSTTYNDIKNARMATAPGGPSAGATRTVTGYGGGQIQYSFSVTNGLLTSITPIGPIAGLSIGDGMVNVQGDNKFDFEYLSQLTPNSNLELGFGRIDLSNGVPDEYESLRLYLNKNHRYKTASPDFLPGRRGAERGGNIGFGMINIAALASLPGALGMSKFDLINTNDYPPIGSAFRPNSEWDADSAYTATHPYLFYFKGSDAPSFSDGGKAVFWTGMQSHWGYWFSNSPSTGTNVMQRRLGEDNYTLSYTWSIGNGSVQTSYLYHRMGMGFDTGDMMRISMSNRSSASPTYAYSPNPLFMAHMGDPTLRLFMFPPPTALSVTKAGVNPSLSWTAARAPEAGEPQVLGYHVYRAASPNGPFTRLTTTPVADTTYVDASVNSGQYAYMVRAVRLETTGGGSFYNASLGALQSIDLTNAPAPLQVATNALPDANWNTPYAFTLQATGGVPNCNWSLIGGALPSGLSLAPSGLISGSPGQAINSTFTVLATDAAGQSAQKTLTLAAGSSDSRIFFPEAAQYISASFLGTTYSSSLFVSGPTYNFSTFLRFNLASLDPHQSVTRARLIVNGAVPTNQTTLLKAALTTDAGDAFDDFSVTYATRPVDNTSVAPVTANALIRSYQPVELDVTSMVRATLGNDPAKKVGLRLFTTTPAALGAEGRIASRFAPLTSRPRLIVETTDGPAIAISTPLSSPATIRVGSMLQIGATVTPKPPRVATARWTQVSGPGVASFGSSDSPSTTVSFSSPGDYLLRLTADDAVLPTTRDVAVRVAAAPVSGPTAGMVIRLPLDESSGTSVADVSGSIPPNQGAISGNPIWRTDIGKIGGCLKFDGTGDRITIPDSSANPVDGLSQFAVSCWINPSTITARAVIVKRVGAGVGESFTIASQAGGRLIIDVGPYASASTNRLTSSFGLVAGTWYHVVFVFDGSLDASEGRMQLYLNGVPNQFQATTVSSVPRNPGAPLRIGGYETDGNAFSGLIDEVRIYNRVLTVPEILDLYQAVPSNIGPQISLPASTVAGAAGQPFNVSATVSDDGLPGALGLLWTQTSGPGGVLFGNPAAASTTGVASVGGSYLLNLQASDGDITTAATLVATISGQTFNTWAAGYGLAGADADAGANPTHDGAPNLLKYALGLDPTVNYRANAPGLPKTEMQSQAGNDYLTLSFQGVAADVIYTVEATSDLTGSWTALYTFSGPGAPGPVTVTDTQPISSAPKRFMRLRISQP